MYRYTLFILVIVVLFLISCAWENVPIGGEPDNLRVQITMELQGQIDKTLFYFFVFNFSGNPDKKPEPEFEDDKRGLNWDVYYMYGNPRLSGYDFWRGMRGITEAGTQALDDRPIPSQEMFEFVPTSRPTPLNDPSGKKITLELDFGNLPTDKYKSINMNMMVSSLPFDRIDNPDDLFDAFIYDSFLFDGVTIVLDGNKIDFNDTEFQVEVEENIGENPPPNANIVDWRLLILE